MVRTTSNQHFQDLLQPLYDAGWSEVVPLHRAVAADSAEALQQVALRRSCMVLGVQHVPSPKSREQVIFVPVAAHLTHPDDGIGLFDAVTEPETIAGVSHGLQPFVIEDVAAGLGLLDPTRFDLPTDTSAQERVDFLVRMYGRYVGRVAAKWRGGNTLRALRALDDDEPFTQMVKGVMYLAQNVVPDPVPMAAAIGITLDCWRNTELERAHVGSKTLTDVVMAKLNIATTRVVRSYITTTGIDWDGVGGVLLDPERQLSPARTVAEVVGDHHWPGVQASIQAKLDNWLHIASVAGPEATLRLASAMGSTDYTAHWWGNGWWTEFSDQVLHHVEDKFPELLPSRDDEFAGRRLASEVFHDPESLSDDVLSALIDPPDGKGLRFADLLEIKRHRLGRMRRSHRDASGSQRAPYGAGVDAEVSPNLDQRQTRRVELNCTIDLVLGHGLTTHRRADVTQKPEHAALAQPVLLRELSRRDASVVVRDESLCDISVETLRQLVAKPVSYIPAVVGWATGEFDDDAIDGNSGGILFRVTSHQLHNPSKRGCVPLQNFAQSRTEVQQPSTRRMTKAQIADPKGSTPCKGCWRTGCSRCGPVADRWRPLRRT